MRITKLQEQAYLVRMQRIVNTMILWFYLENSKEIKQQVIADILGWGINK